MLMRLLRWSGHMDDRDVLVRVKSWRPSRDKYGIGWPTMLVDRCGSRRTATPIWSINT